MDITIDSLSYQYPGGVLALRGVSLVIQSGERVAIIGQNGAGKTTLVKHLNGLLKPVSGSVGVGDWDTRQHSVAHLAARVGYVFQNPDDQLFQSKVLDEVMFGPKNLGWSTSRMTNKAHQALEVVELSDFSGRHPYDLSPGQRKRVAIAAVLAMDTPVVVLDEPTTGQDQAGIELAGRITTMLHEQQKTVISITHDIDFCAEYFERVIVMSGGQVTLDGPARTTLAQTAELSQANVDPPQLMRLAARLGLEFMPLNVQEFVDQLLGDIPECRP